jgi:exportin-2 (importin alpha re-exporter)
LELHRALLTSRTPTFLALLDLFTLPQDITYSAGNGAADDLLELDPEEAGFQSSFSKLGASEISVHDPVAHVGDAKVYASREISTRSKERPGVVCLPAQTRGHALITRSNPWSSRPKAQRPIAWLGLFNTWVPMGMSCSPGLAILC